MKQIVSGGGGRCVRKQVWEDHSIHCRPRGWKVPKHGGGRRRGMLGPLDIGGAGGWQDKKGKGLGQTAVRGLSRGF